MLIMLILFRVTGVARLIIEEFCGIKGQVVWIGMLIGDILSRDIHMAERAIQTAMDARVETLYIKVPGTRLWLNGWPTQNLRSTADDQGHNGHYG